MTGKSKPRSGSSRRFLSCLTSSIVNGSSSKICTRLRIAGDREKGFSVVAPIAMTRPLSSKGKRKSCLFYQGDGSHPKAGPNHQKIWLPLRFLGGVFTVNRCIKGRAYLVVPAMAEAILVFPIPGVQRIIEDRRLASTMRRMILPSPIGVVDR